MTGDDIYRLYFGPGVRGAKHDWMGRLANAINNHFGLSDQPAPAEQSDAQMLDWLLARCDPLEVGLTMSMFDDDAGYLKCCREAIRSAMTSKTAGGVGTGVTVGVKEPHVAFREWAGSEGYDTAHTYDTDRSRWLFLNPMTADLWKCWQAASGVQGQVKGSA